MLFNSFEFAIFLPIVFIIYWHVVNRDINSQNLLIIISSYIFYGWWDWRFLSLIIFSSTTDYYIGKTIHGTNNNFQRKLLLISSIFVNIGFLSIFKYYNFFISSFVDAFSIFGISIDATPLNIILPVGISFYTFQTLSYTFDIYKGKVKPARNALSFFAFVGFFPQLVAGPIERAHNLLPQFDKKREFTYSEAADGTRQILLGLFKKVVIADNCAQKVNSIFDNYQSLDGSTLLLGAFYFAFQIYGDFSGYSDIAIGTSKLFGIKLKRNFAYPYFSRDIAEFWRRWHISLSSWFRDYVYYPLGGSRCSKLKHVRNVFVIFLVSGFWHGANWTFITWGFVNALYFIPLMLFNKNRRYLNVVSEGSLIPKIKELRQIATTFFMVLLAWIFFRSESVSSALEYISRLFSYSLFNQPEEISKRALLGIFILVIIEWFQRDKEHAFQFDSNNLHFIYRYSLYYGVVIAMFFFGGIQQDFIYFQF